MIIPEAKKLSKTQEYYFSRKLKEIQSLKQQGKNIINLGIGSPDLPPSDKVLKVMTEETVDLSNHGYQSYQGILSLRTAISAYQAKHYQISLDPQDEILPLMGSKEGIMHISMAFLNPGDKVLLPNPGYPTYEAVTNLNGAIPLKYSLDEFSNWDLNIAAIKKLPLDEVKLMWINYPNMPTGMKANNASIKQLISLAKKHQFLIINDNPYSQLFQDIPFSIFQFEGAKEVAIELNSLSKSHNMAGWRIGWVSGKSTYLSTILKVKSNMDSGMFLPIQLAAIEALSLPSSYYQKLRNTYSQRRLIALDIFNSLNCEANTQQEGMFSLAKIPDRVNSSETLVDEILNKCGVFITPGFIFGSNCSQYLRISLCSSEDILKEALQRIKNLKK